MKRYAIIALCLLAATLYYATRAGSAPEQKGKIMTARELIERIKANVNCEWSARTVDTIKAGEPDAPVTGIATTTFATMDVLKQAAAANCNLVITHEPTFYGHNDDAARLGEDRVVAAKLAFIKKHNLVVWRFHDHWRRHQPDGIVQGTIEALGLGQQRRADENNLFDVPETTVREFAAALKKRLGARVVRVVGEPEMKFTKVALVVGAPGGVRQMNALQRDDVEVLLAGESPEWETTEYVRDTMQQGRRKALIFLGHTNSEEAGMKHCATWLKGFVKDVPIKFIPAGDPFWTP